MPPPRARGFTMIELVVTIAIAGILLAIAAPGLQNFLAGRAVAAQSEDILSALHYARSEALKRGSPVTICRTTAAAPATCDTASTGTWQYWMVFADSPSTLGTLDAGEAKLRVESAPAGSVTYTAMSAKYFSFQSTGIVIPATATDLPATIDLKPRLSSSSSAFKRYERQICIDKMGRSSLVDGNGACSS
jgi:type IV fimbrial biogenesis protein FimT